MLHSQDRLRIFCVAAEADSFRDAAARLGIPPQGVTRAVQEPPRVRIPVASIEP